MRFLLIFISSLLLAVTAPVQGLEVVSQNIELTTYAQVSPVFISNPATDNDTRQNQGVGDRLLASISSTSLTGISVSSEANVTFRRTNSIDSEVFVMESAFSMNSQDVPHPSATQTVMRASAAMNLFIQVRSETPIQFRISTLGQPAPALPGSGGIAISTVNNSTPLVEIRWPFGLDHSGESRGSLPAGTYFVRFYNSAGADGTVYFPLENHISGTARATATIEFTPGTSAPVARPSVRIERGPSDLVYLELNNLSPGMTYFLERSDALTAQFWQATTSFISAGTNAVWTDAIDRASQNVFYRLRN